MKKIFLFLDMLVKICANFYPNPKKSNAQETFFTSMLFTFSSYTEYVKRDSIVLFNIRISQEIIHKVI